MNPALLIVDLQNDYFKGGVMELTGIEAASLNAQKILKHARYCGWPVFHIRHISVHEGAEFFLPDTKGSQIHASVTPIEGEPVFIKHFPNSFLGTDLGKTLQGQSIRRLVICGAMSHMCIDATVRAAFDLGFTCMVAHDACATKDLSFQGRTIKAASVHAAFMAALHGVYAQVFSCDDILNSEEMR